MNTWHAALALDYRLGEGRTVLARRHQGPLQVQKALYPEGEALCHTLLIRLRQSGRLQWIDGRAASPPRIWAT